MQTRVADYIADVIVKKQVKNVFLLSGGGIMHLLDGIARNHELTLIYHNHEQCAGIAAEAYARIRGGLSFCCGTSGPGALNLVTAIAGAWLDSTPVVFLTGQSKSSQTIRNSQIAGLRQYGTFEVDIIEIVKSITKFTWFLDSSSDAPYIFGKACEIALSGRPGPVLIDIPVDIQGALMEPDQCKKYHPLIEKLIPDSALVEKIAAQWITAKRPVILAGSGVRVAGMVMLLKDIAVATATPIITTQLGKDTIAYEDEFFIGHPGLKGDRAGNFAVQNADFILTLGASLHVFTTGYELNKFAPKAWIAQVDLDKAIFDREEIGVDLKCLADIKSFLTLIHSRESLKSFNREVRSQWHKWLIKCKKKFNVSAEPHKVENGRINIYQVIDVARRLTKGDEIIVADAGSAFYTIGQAWKVKKDQRIIISGGLGAMGWAFPAATGASIAEPGKTVICLTGDGSAQTNIHELAVISHNNCNIKIIIFNNEGYLSIKNTQDNYFEGYYAGVDAESGVFIPSIGELAAAYHINHCRICTTEEFETLLPGIFETPGPFIIEVMTNTNQEIIPGVSSKKLKDGSMVSMPLENMSPFLDAKEFEEIIHELD